MTKIDLTFHSNMDCRIKVSSKGVIRKQVISTSGVSVPSNINPARCSFAETHAQRQHCTPSRVAMGPGSPSSGCMHPFVLYPSATKATRNGKGESFLASNVRSRQGDDIQMAIFRCGPSVHGRTAAVP